jgi:hypothetical protein
MAAMLLTLAAAGPVSAQEAVRLSETFAPGSEYHVSTRVHLSGELTLPPEKGKAPQPLAISGTSAIEYDERVLGQEKDGSVGKTVRVYRRVDLQRKVGDQPQQSTIRPEVRRLVLLRHGQVEVPFSPDGPLTWNEIDLVRTDVFTPALAGLLPAAAVRVGERWTASTSAVKELTDLERIDEGSVSCRLEETAAVSGRRQARVSFTGTVRGVGEDGPGRHHLDGSLFFDLESNHLSYLTVRGVHTLLDPAGKAAGKVEGTFVLTRQPQRQAKGLGDAALRGLALEPNEDNTLLLYDNPDLGIRFLHPRRWRVAGVKGRQVGLDENRGNGLLLTVESLKTLPGAAQYLQESRTYLQQQKATIVGSQAPQAIQAAPQAVERFSLDVQLGKERVTMVYFVVRQAQGGATIAARLVQQDAAALGREAERVARSVQITRQQQ